MHSLILSLLVSLLLSCSCHGDEQGDAKNSLSTSHSLSGDSKIASLHDGASSSVSHNFDSKDSDSQQDPNDLSNSKTKRAAFWIPEVIGKRNPAALEKRSVSSMYDESDSNDFNDGSLFKVMTRIPKFVGKRIPQFVGKRIPQFVGKRIPQFVGKRIPQFVGKRIPQFVGKRIPQFVGKRIPQFVGKRIPQFVGKRIPQFVGKRIPQFVGKRIPQFVGKRIPQFVGKRFRKFVGKRLYSDAADDYINGLSGLLGDEVEAKRGIPAFVGKRDESQQGSEANENSEIESDRKHHRQRRSLFEKRAWGHMIPWYDMATIYKNQNLGQSYGDIPGFKKRFIAPQFVGKRGMGGNELWLDALRQLEEIRSKPKRFKPPLFLGKRSDPSLDDLFTDAALAGRFREKRSTDDTSVLDASH